MPEGQLLEFSAVTKRFGGITAVSDLTAQVEPGRVTGFLGPNGAGKTTSLRMLLGLVRPTSGRATIGGTPYAKLRHPLRTVGAVLEASSFHPGRTAANHLTVYAQAAGIPRSRVDEVLDLVGLSDAASRRIGGFSLGMRQRLGLAHALLGDPGVLVLDEPANGLDPEGIRWMRGFLRQLAREGRTVLVSSHLLTEIQQTVDALLILSRGSLVFQGGLGELADPDETVTVVDAPDRAALVAALGAADIPFEVLRTGLTVRQSSAAEIGAVAAAAGIALSSLQRRGPALEEVFLDLVNGTRVHVSAAPLAPADADEASSRTLSEPEGRDEAPPAPADPAPADADPSDADSSDADADPADADPADADTDADSAPADEDEPSSRTLSEPEGRDEAPPAPADADTDADSAPEDEDEASSRTLSEPEGRDEAPATPADADTDADSAPEDEDETSSRTLSEPEGRDEAHPDPDDPGPADTGPPASDRWDDTAAFVVAATGVIDVVPAREGSEQR
ncbi:ABC transporter ATP-binding protein [Microbacterium aureliae]